MQAKKLQKYLQGETMKIMVKKLRMLRSEKSGRNNILKSP